MTIMAITHNPHVAAHAERVIYIKDGQIAAYKEFQGGADRGKVLNQWLKEL